MAPAATPFQASFWGHNLCSKTWAPELTLDGDPSCCFQQVVPEPRRQSRFNNREDFLKRNASWCVHSETATVAFSESKLSCVPLPPPGIGNKSQRRNKTFG